jgi:hypothetical protein
MKKILMLSTLLTNLISFSQVPSFVPSDSLIGWWPFNGNANDESGNNNHGEIFNTSLAEDRFGNQNACYEFDVNKYISVSDNNFFRDSNFTISYWFYQDSLNYDYSNRGGVFFGEPGSLKPINIRLNKEYKYIYACSNIISASGNNIFPINNWYHVVLVHDGSNSLNKVYINLELEYEITTTAICSVPNNPNLLFGKNYFTVSPDYHQGKLDDIGIWNKALTFEEITNLFYESNNAGVKESLHHNNILFPNPSSDYINFNNNSYSEISIQDINGKKISDEFYSISKNKIDLRNLNFGLYFLILNGESYKFVKY